LSPFFTQVRQLCSTLQLLSAFSTQQLFSDLLTRNRRRLLSDLNPELDLRSTTAIHQKRKFASD
jgi:hypothetical protein